jgi:hypothetical protein
MGLSSIPSPVHIKLQNPVFFLLQPQSCLNPKTIPPFLLCPVSPAPSQLTKPENSHGGHGPTQARTDGLRARRPRT